MSVDKRRNTLIRYFVVAGLVAESAELATMITGTKHTWHLYVGHKRDVCECKVGICDDLFVEMSMWPHASDETLLVDLHVLFWCVSKLEALIWDIRYSGKGQIYVKS
jgi:hypothetical protein